MLDTVAECKEVANWKPSLCITQGLQIRSNLFYKSSESVSLFWCIAPLHKNLSYLS